MNSREQIARREILYLTVAGMETSFLVLIVPGTGLFLSRFSLERAALVLWVVALLAFNLVRALNALNFKERVQRDLSVFFLFICVLVMLRVTLYHHVPWPSLGWIGEISHHLTDSNLWHQDVGVVIATLVFWWRGLRLAQLPLTTKSVGFRFRIGVLIMVFATAVTSHLSDWNPTPFVFGYFFLSLISVALARTEEVGTWRAGIPFPFSPGWLLSIAAAACAVILLAVGLLAVFSRQSLLRTFALLGPIWDVLSGILMVVVSLLFSALYPLIGWFFRRLNMMLVGTEVDLEPQMLTEYPFDFRSRELMFDPLAFEPYWPILTALAVLVGILVVSLAFGRAWRARKQLGEAKVDSVWVGGGLGVRVQDRLKPLVGGLGFMKRWIAAASIRRIYAQMVLAAARRGFPRSSSVTPYEYLPTLSEAWPGMEPQLESITNAYVKAHYGELPESEEALQAVKVVWDQLRHA